jgi:hypothetical protein
MMQHDETPAPIDEHPFEPPAGRTWDRCTRCGLAEAAHVDAVERYAPTSTRSRPRALDVVCPLCGASVGAPCRSTGGRTYVHAHKRRSVFALNGASHAA